MKSKKSSFIARNGGGRSRIFHTSLGPKAKARREGVVSRLEEQLKKGTKPVGTKNAFVDTSIDIPLTASDKIRIHKEITTLKSRI